VEVITSINIEPLLPNRVSYTRSLSRASDKLRSFRSYLKWVCANQSDDKYALLVPLPLGHFRPYHLSLRSLICPDLSCL
ncbi:hypothetical protein B296_00012127, partial [Ensete ventricosum]